MKLFIGSDHAAFEQKKLLIQKLQESFEVIDVGTHSLESTDYPIYAKQVAEGVLREKALGVLLCGNAQGVSMAANSFKGIRAARCVTRDDACLAKQHSNANVLCLGSRVNSAEDNFEFIQIWLNEEFESRHQKRIDMFAEWGESI